MEWILTKKKYHIPGDSIRDQTLSPIVGGHLTIYKGHLTLRKRSRSSAIALNYSETKGFFFEKIVH